MTGLVPCSLTKSRIAPYYSLWDQVNAKSGKTHRVDLAFASTRRSRIAWTFTWLQGRLLRELGRRCDRFEHRLPNATFAPAREAVVNGLATIFLRAIPPSAPDFENMRDATHNTGVILVLRLLRGSHYSPHPNFLESVRSRSSSANQDLYGAAAPRACGDDDLDSR